VSWRGHYSAESLLRDQTSRSFANGVLWQSDPDCILLRDRFHDLTDAEVHALAVFAGLAGGVLMTSDQLDEVPEPRRAMFAQFVQATTAEPCDFPLLGTGPDPVLVQRVTRGDGSTLLNVFNTGDATEERFIPWDVCQCLPGSSVQPLHSALRFAPAAAGIHVWVPAHGTCLLKISSEISRTLADVEGNAR
jgi:alpha-galactosidase